MCETRMEVMMHGYDLRMLNNLNQWLKTDDKAFNKSQPSLRGQPAGPSSTGSGRTLVCVLHPAHGSSASSTAVDETVHSLPAKAQSAGSDAR